APTRRLVGAGAVAEKLEEFHGAAGGAPGGSLAPDLRSVLNRSQDRLSTDRRSGADTRATPQERDAGVRSCGRGRPLGSGREDLGRLLGRHRTAEQVALGFVAAQRL